MTTDILNKAIDDGCKTAKDLGKWLKANHFNLDEQ